MEDIYEYSKIKFLEKMYTPVGIIIAGFLVDFFYPVTGRYQQILIWIVYFSGIILFSFESLPLIVKTFETWNEKIILTNRSIIIKGNKDFEMKIINRKDIKEVKFTALRVEGFTIPHRRKLKKIDKSIYKLPGREFIIESESETIGGPVVLYLELLPEQFVEDFIRWYQADVALKN
ncbi:MULTISPECIES: hypothetical protein [unclassified Halanaerobium]|uniref:hypothetical protein n=1 Tax=unclassified Halanaerobium TaxID=2641197 RepID=UPI000DF2FD95|nr:MULTISPECIES: hypothetical protein [unclassified Halanaerobium]RCW47777.1 hypothetical protein DFR78_11154 [Halanaerobium sp. MA284_MarDTE_T2]RCW81809.1 hypothetical protein DER71_12238 [Halanaerobium sp. DL-01]